MGSIIDDVLESVQLELLENQLFDEFDVKDFRELGKRERIYFNLRNSLIALKSSNLTSDNFYLKVEDLVTRGEQFIFPWIFKKFKSVDELFDNSMGSGIALPVGKSYYMFAVHAIQIIRHLGCALPIEVFYSGTGDLLEWQIKQFQSMTNVTVVDITQIFNNDILRLSGWAIKPFCILASKFQQVILIDADTVFMQNPSIIFNDPLFKETGTAFYLDRTLFPNVSWQKGWLESFLPHPISNEVRNLRYWRSETAHEMDSAVVAIDKKIVFHGIMAVCSMNSGVQREEVYKKVHGDKETFWIGFNLVKQPFSFNPYLPASVGPITSHLEQDKPLTQVCGKVLHFDHSGKPFWWNGGLVADKYTKDGMQTFFEVEGWSREGQWQFENSCMKNSTVERFGEAESYLVNTVFKKIWKENIIND